MSKRCVAYIDGHNFYHGAIKGNGDLKWLDLRSMCEQMVKRSNLVAVK